MDVGGRGLLSAETQPRRGSQDLSLFLVVGQMIRLVKSVPQLEADSPAGSSGVRENLRSGLVFN